MRLYAEIGVLIILVDVTTSLIDNTTTNDIETDIKNVETRRKKGKKERSTSSSSGERASATRSEDEDESLEVTSSAESSSDGKHRPKSSVERRGWRKWHRSCHKCPEDMVKKWNDPTISWICGGYQRARRSFKSICMMHYRNCQDGTMFIKLHDNRCANSTRDKPYGLHFFYDYKVGSGSSKSKDSTIETDSSSF